MTLAHGAGEVAVGRNALGTLAAQAAKANANVEAMMKNFAARVNLMVPLLRFYNKTSR